jgi:hypothetical protein
MTTMRAEAASTRRRPALRAGRAVTVVLAAMVAAACDEPAASSAPAAAIAANAPAAETKPAAKPVAPIAGFAKAALQKRSTFPSELGIPGTNDGVLIPLIDRSDDPPPVELAPYEGPTWPPAEVAEGPLEIIYPHDGTLFPPEIVAPTFMWQGGGAAIGAWTIAVRTEGELDLAFTSDLRGWRPSEEDW